VGGCYRWALGSGPAGECYVGCELGGSCSGANRGCKYYDFNQQFGDPFVGLICDFTITNPSGNGGPCNTQSECAGGLVCLVDGTCHQICDASFSCATGADCLNFNPPGPVGVCDF
jgi:hypothetical protein